MRVLSETRYNEIKTIITKAGNSTQSQLAKMAKTSVGTVEKVWASVDYEDYRKSLTAEGGKLDNLEEETKGVELTEKLVEEVVGKQEKPSMLKKILSIFKK